jgi:hypothetical protein
LAEKWQKNTGAVKGTVEYRRQAALCLSRICRESPLTASAGFFATLVANEQTSHWYKMILQWVGQARSSPFLLLILTWLLIRFRLWIFHEPCAEFSRRENSQDLWSASFSGVAQGAGVCATEE